ncbi:hypothetical protein H4W81_006741 [Nonomuraea africana]|uniref:Uncharacterized protein n=1 Tax=Nonomuraea africana TaxID=46171 RepID=A0ABR9KPK9_9ACTN|nr:hypothetical protein [Nonomuraea africana]MBE1563962.1 hypothetical protein [Nonomuraea africana]
MSPSPAPAVNAITVAEDPVNPASTPTGTSREAIAHPRSPRAAKYRPITTKAAHSDTKPTMAPAMRMAPVVLSTTA